MITALLPLAVTVLRLGGDQIGAGLPLHQDQFVMIVELTGLFG